MNQRGKKKTIQSYSTAFIIICLALYVALEYIPAAHHIIRSIYRSGNELETPERPDEYFPIAVSNPNLPPLSDFVDDKDVINDVSSLLDFYIVGFPKCGTTSLKNYFRKRVDEVLMARREVCYLSDKRYKNIADVVTTLHGINETSNYTVVNGDENTKPVTTFKRSLKCPVLAYHDECPNCIAKTVQHFRNTKFIVAVRHPVHWFRSYHNFRAYHRYPRFNFHTNDLIGSCSQDTNWVCTDRARFHVFLSKFGKTNFTTSKELSLLGVEDKQGKKQMKADPLPSKVFLIESGQMIDDNQTRSLILRQDLKTFLELQNDLPPIISDYRASDEKMPDYERRRYFIDICDEEHSVARSVLVQHGREAAQWIREFFVTSPDVFVSSKEDFLDRLKLWEVDPCDESVKTDV